MGGDAWGLAEEHAAKAGVELRALTSLEDADQILRVMIATWGEHQLIPREMLRALGDSVDPPYGAFADGVLVGYVLGWIAADEEDGLIVHSHMLAALPERRHRGIGYALKLAQRAQALALGLRVVRWTFDPLIARNAWFNLRKLGAVADRYHRNYYGEMTDTVNRGERTDRFVVRWDLDRVPGSAEGGEDGVMLLVGEERPDGLPVPVREELPRDDRTVLVQIPRDLHTLRSTDATLASAWREAVADAAERCLATGRRARGFTPDSAYVFA